MNNTTLKSKKYQIIDCVHTSSKTLVDRDQPI